MTDENVLKISPAVKAEDKQFISISKAIRSAKGQKLAEDFDRWFAIPSTEPMVKFLSRGVVLPSSAGMNLPFQAINYAKVRVRVKRIYENTRRLELGHRSLHGVRIHSSFLCHLTN